MNTQPKTYDPNLRLAIAEIAEILKRRDIMALIFLGSLTHGEFMLNTDASWSVMKPDKMPDGRQAIRFKAKGIKVGSKEHECLEATAAFICNTADSCNRFGQIFYGLKAQIAKASVLEHSPLTDDRITNDDREGIHQ